MNTYNEKVTWDDMECYIIDEAEKAEFHDEWIPYNAVVFNGSLDKRFEAKIAKEFGRLLKKHFNKWDHAAHIAVGMLEFCAKLAIENNLIPENVNMNRATDVLMSKKQSEHNMNKGQLLLIEVSVWVSML